MLTKDSINLEVIGYEDIMNEDLEYVTYYQIQVNVYSISKTLKQASTVSSQTISSTTGSVSTSGPVTSSSKKILFSYKIRKRYTDFALLYGVFKDQLPCSYRFPNKSYFSNSSNVTKDRRVRGFHELVTILYSAFAFPSELRDFLDYDRQVAEFLQSREGETGRSKERRGSKKNTKSPPAARVVTSSTSCQESSSYESEASGQMNRMSIRLLDKELEFSHYLMQNDINYSILKAIKLKFLVLLRRALVLSLGLYILILSLGIVRYQADPAYEGEGEDQRQRNGPVRVSQISCTTLSFFVMFFLLQFRSIRQDVIGEYRRRYKDQLRE